MSDDRYNEGRSWHQDRRQKNRGERYEHIKVEGYTRSDGVHVKGYTRRPPLRR